MFCTSYQLNIFWGTPNKYELDGHKKRKRATAMSQLILAHVMCALENMERRCGEFETVEWRASSLTAAGEPGNWF